MLNNINPAPMTNSEDVQLRGNAIEPVLIPRIAIRDSTRVNTDPMIQHAHQPASNPVESDTRKPDEDASKRWLVR